ncbi:MAG: sigma-54-dependent Fis family transcriptional regulator [Rhodocyclaceae bacterium]|nr:sigma-54-dependent Fis family transcriptional regulator [Rhodocyclaceae bacterium]
MTDPPAELLSYLESLPDPHVVFDRDYRIRAANAAYLSQHAGAAPVVGRRCFEVSHHYRVPCDQAGESCPLARALDSGRRERVMHLHHTPRGEAYVDIRLSPVRDGAGEIRFFVERIAALPARPSGEAGHGMIGRAEVFRAMLSLVSRVAPSEVAVLLQGESGSGKEVVAHAIHAASRRADKPFVVVDCSGLPETLIESELFGHERGAFTGANARRAGLVEAARGGTLFLDELGDIPLAVQVKLLRLLEAGAYRRLGGSDLLPADVRVISATHRPLREMVADGRFRQDLYYRINAFPITVPPLRERREDIAELAALFLRRLAAERPLSLAPAALAALERHPFPGNIRELRNVLERAALLCDGTRIEPMHLPEELARGVSDIPCQGAPLAEAEGAALARLLAAHAGSRKALAAQLGVSERTLYRKLKFHGLGGR